MRVRYLSDENGFQVETVSFPSRHNRPAADPEVDDTSNNELLEGLELDNEFESFIEFFSEPWNTLNSTSNEPTEPTVSESPNNVLLGQLNNIQSPPLPASLSDSQWNSQNDISNESTETDDDNESSNNELLDQLNNTQMPYLQEKFSDTPSNDKRNQRKELGSLKSLLSSILGRRNIQSDKVLQYIANRSGQGI